MRAKNNSSIQVCTDNLLKTVKGEVPYSREKGIAKNIVDIPQEMAQIKIITSADRCLGTYEPRIDIRNIVTRNVSPDGNLSYVVNATANE